MESHPYEDWSHLHGREIEIRRSGQLVRTGVVDAVMAEPAVLWLIADHQGNRALFEKAEGYEAWLDATSATDLPVVFASHTDPRPGWI